MIKLGISMAFACLSTLTGDVSAVADPERADVLSVRPDGGPSLFSSGKSPRSADADYVRAERAKGKTPDQIIEERKAAGDYYSRCPDTAFYLDDSCVFTGAIAALRTNEAATARVGAAIGGCTRYDQVTINHCVEKLSQKVDAELDRIYEQSLAAARKADATKAAECEAGEGFACGGGGMDHSSSLVASQRAWSTYADNQCIYQTEGNVGGSGHASFGAICWLELAAARVDQLTETKPYGFEAAR